MFEVAGLGRSLAGRLMAEVIRSVVTPLSWAGGEGLAVGVTWGGFR